MNKVRILLKVASTKAAEAFYCKDLGLFEFHQDYGMGTIALKLKANPSFHLVLSTGNVMRNDNYIFEIETKNCYTLFNHLRQKRFVTSGQLINQEVFEYPLGKSIAIKDPSNNKFLIFEEYD